MVADQLLDESYKSSDIFRLWHDPGGISEITQQSLWKNDVIDRSTISFVELQKIFTSTEDSSMEESLLTDQSTINPGTMLRCPLTFSWCDDSPIGQSDAISEEVK